MPARDPAAYFRDWKDKLRARGICFLCKKPNDNGRYAHKECYLIKKLTGRRVRNELR